MQDIKEMLTTEYDFARQMYEATKTSGMRRFLEGKISTLEKILGYYDIHLPNNTF